MTLPRYLINSLLVFCLSFLFIPVLGQQVLVPLEANEKLYDIYQRELQNAFHAKSSGDTVDTIEVDLLVSRIIFRDDFSDYLGWPKQGLWVDQSVYINRSFGYQPFSVGVATFDGLDFKGYPYQFNGQASSDRNDTLTSNPIDLSVIDLNDPDIDSVYLSFFYQPQGMNPFPTEKGDSLVLEFFDIGTMGWSQVWSAEGAARAEFKKATVLVDTLYHKRGFQFRFSNFGNQAGSVDHWNLDYVYMTSNTRHRHDSINDMALRYPQVTLLKQYTAMPWWHYETVDMRNDLEMYFYYFNKTVYNGKSPDVNLHMTVIDQFGNEVFSQSSSQTYFGFLGAKNFNLPFNALGNNTYPVASSETVNFYTFKTYYKFNDISLDDNRANDSIVERQVFGTYYAYDDGMAEAGYGVNGTGNRLAYLYDIGTETDTLKGVNIYFNPVINDRSREQFRLAVWYATSTGSPGDLMYRNEKIDRPTYTALNKFQGVGVFQRYNFEKPLVVTGKFFIGYQKVSDKEMNIGYDVNRNSQDKIYVDFRGYWERSDSAGGNIVPGSLMMRPVFRTMEDPIISVAEIDGETEKISIYPNPARDVLFVNIPGNSFENGAYELELYNTNGQLILSTELIPGKKTDISSVNDGFYLVTIKNRFNNERTVKKLLISR